AGIIKGYTININHRDFGIVVWGNLLIRFKDPQKIFSKLKGFAAEKINIGRSFLLFGEWNAELGFSAENIDTLHELISDFLTKFSTEIIDYEIIFNQQGHKYPPVALGIFKN
ncbi:Lrp/AsnC family transcriptional regulator, partial [Candidatus Woesearchaeota archaeon]|nr:Lrp/AsnC family transcriptional regulator [Candidatus Woesearchaeota archaeon]